MSENNDEANRTRASEDDHQNTGLNEDGAKDRDSAVTNQDDSKTRKPGGQEVVETTVEVPKRPVKRARTAYFVFADERRPEVQKQHVGEGVAAIGRALGQLWSTLTDEEKQVYQQKAAAERERVARDLEAWNKAHGDKPSVDEVFKNCSAAAPHDPSALGYPSARVRKICKLDPEVRGLSKEALLLVTKAAELTTVKLGIESVRVAQIQNRRKLLPEDVAMVCRTRDQFAFLKQDVLDLVREQQQQQQDGKKTNNKGNKQTITSNPITSYFAPSDK